MVCKVNLRGESSNQHYSSWNQQSQTETRDKTQKRANFIFSSELLSFSIVKFEIKPKRPLPFKIESIQRSKTETDSNSKTKTFFEGSILEEIKDVVADQEIGVGLNKIIQIILMDSVQRIKVETQVKDDIVREKKFIVELRSEKIQKIKLFGEKETFEIPRLITPKKISFSINQSGALFFTKGAAPYEEEVDQHSYINQDPTMKYSISSDKPRNHEIPVHYFEWAEFRISDVHCEEPSLGLPVDTDIKKKN